MGSFEVQGVVSSEDGMPYIQMRQVDAEENLKFGFQVSPMEAREIAQSILEAAANAIYEAALVSWAKERDPKDGEVMAIMMVDGIRKHRADRWGLPDKPSDWSGGEEKK